MFQADSALYIYTFVPACQPACEGKGIRFEICSRHLGTMYLLTVSVVAGSIFYTTYTRIFIPQHIFIYSSPVVTLPSITPHFLTVHCNLPLNILLSFGRHKSSFNETNLKLRRDIDLMCNQIPRNGKHVPN